MLETTSYDPLSPRSSSDEPRSGEEDLEIDWVLAYNFDDIGTEPKDLGVWQCGRCRLPRVN